MGDISSKLTSFRSSVDPQIGSMSSLCEKLQSKLEDMSNITKAVRNAIEKAYVSENIGTVTNKFNQIENIYSKIKISVSSDMRNMISQSKIIINLINDLDTINKQIASQREHINSNPEDSSSAYSKINSLNNKFNEVHENALKKLDKLKAMDESLSFVEEFSPSNNDPNIEDLQYGSFELKQTFVASNNIKIDYYMYVPDYGKDVKNLPLLCYMHGGGSNRDLQNEAAIRYGLGSHIANKRITPECLVCVPVVREFNKPGYQALQELYEYVAKEYEADPDRIAISGHSYGGIAASEIVNANPDFYSCCVTLSGISEASPSFKNVPTWLFNANYERTDSTGAPHSKKEEEKIKSYGGKASQTIIPGGHSDTNANVYLNEYMNPDGEMSTVLQWIVKQRRQ